MRRANIVSTESLSDRLTEVPLGALVLAVVEAERDEDFVDLQVTCNAVATSRPTPRQGQIHEWMHVTATTRMQRRQLDSTLHELGKEPFGVLEADAQGAGLEAFRSAVRYLSPREIPAVVVELHFRDSFEEQDYWSKCVTHLQLCEYSMVEAESHRDAVGEVNWADALFVVPC